MRYNLLIDTLQNLIGFVPKQAHLCKILDCTSAAMSGRAKRDSEFSDDELEKIEDHYGIVGQLIPGRIETIDMVSLDFYPDVYASCGNGAYALSEAKEKLTVNKSMMKNYTPHKDYIVMQSKGLSMFPTINNGDRLVVERVYDNSIIDNEIYVFIYEGALYTKRLVKNVNELVIKCDNPDKDSYRTRILEKSEMNNVTIIGHIVGLMRTF